MKTHGDKKLAERFKKAFAELARPEKTNVDIKVSYGLVFIRGQVATKKDRLKIVESALMVMDEVLGTGNRRIIGSPR